MNRFKYFFTMHYAVMCFFGMHSDARKIRPPVYVTFKKTAFQLERNRSS
jgi:hypothetical protein